jgi:hypothetical protein
MKKTLGMYAKERLSTSVNSKSNEIMTGTTIN